MDKNFSKTSTLPWQTFTAAVPYFLLVFSILFNSFSKERQVGQKHEKLIRGEGSNSGAYYSGTTYVSFFQNRFGKCQYRLPTIQTTREGISLSIRADIRDILHHSRDIHLHSRDIHLHNRDIRHLNRYAQHHWKDIQILSRYTVDIYGPYGRNTASTAGILTSTAGILTSHSWHIQTPRQ
jgi:hypothetical protein